MEPSTRILHLSEYYVFILPVVVVEFYIFLNIMPLLLLVVLLLYWLLQAMISYKTTLSTRKYLDQSEVKLYWVRRFATACDYELWYTVVCRSDIWWRRIVFYGDLTLKPYYTESLKFLFRKEYVSNKSNDFHREERLSPH